MKAITQRLGGRNGSLQLQDFYTVCEVVYFMVDGDKLKDI
jgi:hypothetical protein